MDRQPDEKKPRSTVFIPCVPELAYCTDCKSNRQKGHCPRQKSPRCEEKSFAGKNQGNNKKNIQHQS